MQKNSKNTVALPKICDCTIRDGGYLNNWNFDIKIVRQIYRALSKSGVDYVELGYRNIRDSASGDSCGIWKFTPEEAIREVTQNIHGAKIAVMVDFGKIEAAKLPDKDKTLIDLIRVAVHKDRIPEALKLCAQLKGKGFSVSLNLMGYSNFTASEKRGLLAVLKNPKIDYLYIADSYGSLFPAQTKELFRPFAKIKKIKMGFHPHNNLQVAFANALEAIAGGAHIVDSSIYGMGRAAGNLPTEIILSYFESFYKDKYNVVPVLNIIDKYFLRMHKEIGWGYNLSYMLSGMFKCHPDYPKYLSELHEFQIEDIWEALSRIGKMNPVGFSKEAVDTVIKQGLFSAGLNRKHNIPSSGRVRQIHIGRPSYVNRHKGRDFLVLANGPTLKEYKRQISRFIDKINPVVLGANYLGGLFVPDYHAFNNKRRFIDYIDTVNKNSRLLIGSYVSDEMAREYTDKEYEKLAYLDRLGNNFEIQNGVISTNCKTISVLLIGVAIVMGAKRIFVAGMDGYIYPQQQKHIHFYNEADEPQNPGIIKDRHNWNLFYLDQIDDYLCGRDKDGLILLTPTAYKRFYKGINNYI